MELNKELYRECGNNPLLFIEKAFGLRPQNVLEDYRLTLEECRKT